MPTPPFDDVSLDGTGDAGGAEVLDADDQAGVEDLEAGLDEPLLLEGVADLHARPLVVVPVLAEAGRRQHAGAADAVAAGRRAEQHRQVADAGRPRQHEPLRGQHAEAEDVDERVVLIGGVEHASRHRRSARRRSCHSRTPRTRRPRRSSGCAGRPTDRIGADPSARSGGHRRRTRRGGCRPPRWPRPRRARWPTGGCGSRCGTRPRCRRRRRPPRRPRRDRRARAAPRWAGGAGGSATTCTSSARTTSRRTSPARGGSAPGRGSLAMRSASSSVRPSARWRGTSAGRRRSGHRAQPTRRPRWLETDQIEHASTEAINRVPHHGHKAEPRPRCQTSTRPRSPKVGIRVERFAAISRRSRLTSRSGAASARRTRCRSGSTGSTWSSPAPTRSSACSSSRSGSTSPPSWRRPARRST